MHNPSNIPDVELDPSQVRAVDLMCSQKADICLVTGGPGTGKTTCTRAALDRLDELGQRFLLAAPTGKAAKRMSEATGRESRTIHRLLEFNPRLGGFQRNASNPLDADAVFVDESSMLDIELAASLMRAIDRRRTRLVLIGDADQLPPVGAGRPFGDLIDAGQDPTVRLTTLHRSALESWIHVNAQRVLRGEMLDLKPRKDFRFIEVETGDLVIGELVKLVTKVIPEEIDAPYQVLIPQRTGPAGIELANPALQAALNPRQGEDAAYLPRGKSELRVSDRVIQTKNDYMLAGGLGVFNGELGEIVSLDKSELYVLFPDRGEVRYSLEQSNALQHAYALTVHRFQGSEVPWAVVVCHSTHYKMLTRQLLYTAITRGKKGVILVGNQKGLRGALDEKKPPVRNTALNERIENRLDAPVL